MQAIAIMLLLLAGAALSKDHYIFHLYQDKADVEYLYTDFSKAHYPLVDGAKEAIQEVEKFIKQCRSCKISLFVLERDKRNHRKKTILKTSFYVDGKEHRKSRSKKTFYDHLNIDNEELYGHLWDELKKNLNTTDRLHVITYGHLDPVDPYSMQSYNSFLDRIYNDSLRIESLLLHTCYGQDIVDQIPVTLRPNRC
jgi:hypothetical protein